MARRYRITVEGKTYEVEVEDITKGSTGASPVQPTPAARPAPAPAASPAPAPAQKPTAPAASGSGTVTAPMPGVISEILVKPGDAVKRGAVLVMLEAMKMQNEIMSPADGKVLAVPVSKGATVNTGDLLVEIGPA